MSFGHKTIGRERENEREMRERKRERERNERIREEKGDRKIIIGDREEEKEKVKENGRWRY